MFNRTTFFVGDALRRLSGPVARNAGADGGENAEEVDHHVNLDDDDDEYDGHDDGYDERDYEQDEYDEERDEHDDDEIYGGGERTASVDDLFGPGELEQRLAEEAAGIDPYAADYGEGYTEADGDDLENRRADFDDDEVADVADEDRAAVDAIFDEIRRKAADDQAAALAMYNDPVVFASDSSSSVGSISTCTGSDYAGSRVGSPARRLQTPPPQELEEPKTPDFSYVPPTSADGIALTPALIASLAGAPRQLILRSLLGRAHGTKVKPSRYGEHTPFTSPAHSDCGEDESAHDAPQALSVGQSAALAEASIPTNRLRRTMNGDYFAPDGHGGYISTRSQRHVDRVWERSHEESNMLNSALYQAAHLLAHAGGAQQQPAPRARSPSVESEDIDMAGYDTSEDEAGDCSPSPADGTSSQLPQDVVPPPVHLPASPSRPKKRALYEDDADDADAHVEKKPRVPTEEQPGSPLAERARAGRRTHTQPGPSTAATRTTFQINTATTTAPAHENAGLAVVVNNEYAADASDEMAVDSQPVEAAAGPSRQPAEGPPPARQTRRRGRAAAQALAEEPRRSTRIRENNELARAKAAAAPKVQATTRRRRGGNGRA